MNMPSPVVGFQKETQVSKGDFIMLKNNKNKEKSEVAEIESLLDKIWKNWESRRKCEQTHVPNYINEKKERKNKN